MTFPPAPPSQGDNPPELPGYYPPVAVLPPSAYVSWGTRVVALLIDLAIGMAILLPGTIALVVAVVTTGSCASTDTGTGIETSCDAAPSVVAVLLFLLSVPAALGFGIWNYGYRQGTTGSSVGKSVMKFTVVSEATGQPIGFGRSVLRQIIHTVDSALLGLGYLFPLWDAKRQTFADKIMSTVCFPTR